MPSRAASCWRRCGRPGCPATQTRSVRRPQRGDRGQGFLWKRAGRRRQPLAWLCGAFLPARALPRSLARGRSWSARGRLGGVGGPATCGFLELPRRWQRRSPTPTPIPRLPPEGSARLTDLQVPSFSSPSASSVLGVCQEEKLFCKNKNSLLVITIASISTQRNLHLQQILKT